MAELNKEKLDLNNINNLKWRLKCDIKYKDNVGMYMQEDILCRKRFIKVDNEMNKNYA